MKFNEYLKNSLNQIKEKNLYRERFILDKNIINFCSNDYLGLKDNEYTKQKLKEFIKDLPVGSGASALVSGYYEIQKNLEQNLSNLKDTESSIVVGTGYMANIGLISAITTEEDIIFSDEYNHASIIDGIRLSKAKKFIYKHKDIEDLENKIKENKTKGNIFIITDGVFSMEGDIAPLKELYQIAKIYDAVLIIDDAHATGIIGNGKGSLFEFNIKPDENIIQVGTLSKAIGSFGAFISGSKLLIDFLVNKARPVIFSTALSPVQNFISLINLEIMQKEEFRRKELFEKSKYFATKLKEIGFNIEFHNTPIFSIILKDEKKALIWRDYLLKNNIFIQAIRPPTVPIGSSRLRITISYSHKYEDIDRLLDILSFMKENL